jgi:uncharacterized membrane protein
MLSVVAFFSLLLFTSGFKATILLTWFHIFSILNKDFTSHRKRYYGCPDDKTFRHMASVYSQSHYNMSLSKEFEGGITNGALW